MDLCQQIENICKIGDYKALDKILNKYDYKLFNITIIRKSYKFKNSWSYLACKYGHIEIAERIIKFINDIVQVKNGLYGACEGGHLSIVEKMINLSIRDLDYNDINKALRFACRGGHVKIAERIIELANLKECFDQIQFNEALYYACIYDHLDMAEKMINFGADPTYGLYFSFDIENFLTLPEFSINVVINNKIKNKIKIYKYGQHNMQIAERMIDLGAEFTSKTQENIYKRWIIDKFKIISKIFGNDLSFEILQFLTKIFICNEILMKY